jgi:hypothetical protein
MHVRVIKFTRETIPTIYAEYPNLQGRWDATGLFLTEEEYVFVHDTAFTDGNKHRVLNTDHFQDVYEIPASEIGTTFKRIY